MHKSPKAQNNPLAQITCSSLSIQQMNMDWFP